MNKGYVSSRIIKKSHGFRNILLVVLIVFLIGLAYSIVVDNSSRPKSAETLKLKQRMEKVRNTGTGDEGSGTSNRWGSRNLDPDVIEQLRKSRRISVKYEIAGAGANTK